MNIERTIEMADERCYKCGRFWAHEKHFHCECPYCAREEAERGMEDRNVLRRSNAALRGALKRRKK